MLLNVTLMKVVSNEQTDVSQAVWKNHLRQSGISTSESLAAEEEVEGRGRSKARL